MLWGLAPRLAPPQCPPPGSAPTSNPAGSCPPTSGCTCTSCWRRASCPMGARRPPLRRQSGWTARRCAGRHCSWHFCCACCLPAPVLCLSAPHHYTLLFQPSFQHTQVVHYAVQHRKVANHRRSLAGKQQGLDGAVGRAVGYCCPVHACRVRSTACDRGRWPRGWPHPAAHNCSCHSYPSRLLSLSHPPANAFYLHWLPAPNPHTPCQAWTRSACSPGNQRALCARPSSSGPWSATGGE